jgi:HEPN domain-containing protein
MNKYIYIVTTIILLFTTAVEAQIKQQPASDYQHVQKRLRFANEMETTFPSGFARSLLNEAENRMKMARALRNKRRKVLLTRHLQRTDALINDALLIILKEPVTSQRQKLKEDFDEAEVIVRQGSSEKAQQVLLQARQAHAKAEDAFDSGDYQKGLEYYRRARFNVKKAIDLAQNTPSDLRIRVDSEKDQLNMLMEKARRALENNQDPNALELFEASERQMNLSQQEVEKGDYEAAIEHYHQATRLLLRIIDLAGETEGSRSTSIHDEVYALDALVKRVKGKWEGLPKNKRSQSSLLMDQILEAQRSAHQNLESGDLEAAQADVQKTRKLIERVSRTLETKPNARTGIIKSEALVELERSASDLKARARNSSDKEIIVMLDYAFQAIKRTYSFYSNNNALLAENSFTIAEVYTNSARRMLDNPDAPGIDKDALTRRLDNTYKRISEERRIESQLDQTNRLRLRTALKFYDLAADEFDAGNLRVSHVNITLADQSLNKITD